MFKKLCAVVGTSALLVAVLGAPALADDAPQTDPTVTEAPAEVVAPPAEEVAPTVEEVAPPVEEAPPVDDIAVDKVIPPAPAARLAPPATVDKWVTWLTPTYVPGLNGHLDASNVGWPQHRLGDGQITPTCGQTVQQDLYHGTQADIDALGDTLTKDGNVYEDHNLVQDWTFVSGPACPTSVVPVSPILKNLCGVDGDHYGLPTSDGITYSPNTSDKSITATANEGFILGALPTGWVGDTHTATFAFNPALFVGLPDRDAPCPVPHTNPPSCESNGEYPTSTNLDAQGWSIKPNRPSISYVEGGIHLDASDGTGSAWIIKTLPAGTHLSDLGNLDTTFLGSHGVYWGGIILEGGDLTEQLHYDDNGRFWTQQAGIFDVDRAGYYQSWAIVDGADQPGTWTGISNPLIGTIKIYVNSGQDVTVATQSYLCGTQPFDYKTPPTPEPFSVTPSVTYTTSCEDGNPVVTFNYGDEEGLEYHYDGERYLTVGALALYKIVTDPNGLFSINEDGTATFDATTVLTGEECVTSTPDPTPTQTTTPPASTPTPTETVTTVASTPTPSASTTTAPVVATATPAAPALATTGSEILPWAAGAVVLILAGITGLMIRRRNA